MLRRVAMRREFRASECSIFKPSDDIKSGPGLVESRNPKGHGKMDALEFHSHNPRNILACVSAEEKKIGKKIECIAMDEGQFVEDLFVFHQRLHGGGIRYARRGPRPRFPRDPVRGNVGSCLACERVRRQRHVVRLVLRRAEIRRSSHSGSSTESPLPMTAPSRCRANLRAAMPRTFYFAGEIEKI